MFLPFNFFFNELDNGTEYTCSEFSDDMKSRGVNDTRDGYIALQRAEETSQQQPHEVQHREVPSPASGEE